MTTRTLLGAMLSLVAAWQFSTAPAAEKASVTTAPLPLWKIQGTNATVYLLGSVHFLQASNYPLAARIEAAFKEAQTVVFETDMEEMKSPEVQQKLLSKAMLPEGETLRKQLTPETYKDFTNHLAGAGLPAEAFDRFEPGMAAITLTMVELQKLGMQPELGVDYHFHELAKEQKKKVVALETVDFQIDMITGISGIEGELLMKATLKDIAKARTMFGDMVRAWESGNNAQLADLLNDALEESPAIYKRLLTDRNAAWVPRIAELVRENKDAIVIVGAGHLVGQGSVIELLEKKGFKPVQLSRD